MTFLCLFAKTWVAWEACLRINLAQIMCEPFSFGNVSNSGVVDDRSEECWWSSFCSAPLQQPPLHEYEMIISSLCLHFRIRRGILNRKTNLSLRLNDLFFLSKSTWWSLSHASFKSQNFGEDYYFKTLVFSDGVNRKICLAWCANNAASRKNSASGFHHHSLWFKKWKVFSLPLAQKRNISA